MKLQKPGLTFLVSDIIVLLSEGKRETVMNKWKAKLQHFMIGRYGADQLGQFLIGFLCVLIILNVFVRSNILYLLELICLLSCYFRIFSKNISKRYQENQHFLGFRNRIFGKWRTIQYKMKQSCQFHIYKCPGCGQKIRIPRGKGKISIHCPKCGIDFIKKS